MNKITITLIIFFCFSRLIEGSEVVFGQDIKPQSYAWEGKNADFQLSLYKKNEKEDLYYDFKAVFTQKNKKKHPEAASMGFRRDALKSLGSCFIVTSLKTFACTPPRELFNKMERELFKESFISLLKNHVSQEICWEEIIIKTGDN